MNYRSGRVGGLASLAQSSPVLDERNTALLDYVTTRTRTSCLLPDYQAQPILMSNMARLAFKDASSSSILTHTLFCAALH